MMGLQTVPAQLFYGSCLDDPCPRRSPAPTHRPVSRSRKGAHGAEAVLQQHRPALD